MEEFSERFVIGYKFFKSHAFALALGFNRLTFSINNKMITFQNFEHAAKLAGIEPKLLEKSVELFIKTNTHIFSTDSYSNEVQNVLKQNFMPDLNVKLLEDIAKCNFSFYYGMLYEDENGNLYANVSDTECCNIWLKSCILEDLVLFSRLVRSVWYHKDAIKLEQQNCILELGLINLIIKEIFFQEKLNFSDQEKSYLQSLIHWIIQCQLDFVLKIGEILSSIFKNEIKTHCFLINSRSYSERMFSAGERSLMLKDIFIKHQNIISKQSYSRLKCRDYIKIKSSQKNGLMSLSVINDQSELEEYVLCCYDVNRIAIKHSSSIEEKNFQKEIGDKTNGNSIFEYPFQSSSSLESKLSLSNFVEQEKITNSTFDEEYQIIINKNIEKTGAFNKIADESEIQDDTVDNLESAICNFVKNGGTIHDDSFVNNGNTSENSLKDLSQPMTSSDLIALLESDM